ncbi:MAG: hypothetical protein ACRDYF_01245 [Acidimicrobiia bacterium]
MTAPSSGPTPRAALPVGAALLVLIAAVAVAVAAGGPGDTPRRISFGLWGDVPYARFNDSTKIPALIADMNAADLAFTVFDGDIKDGGSRCTDDVFTAAAAMFNQLDAPTVYVPGDNEWTDCHRLSNGGYNNVERLEHLRRVMFSATDSFGARRMPLEHQGLPGQAYVENTRWVMGDAVFVGLNVPGSNNNKVNSDAECTDGSARTPADCAANNAEYAARSAADSAWLRQSFAAATGRNARAVMIVMQGNPGFDLPETPDVNERNDPRVDGYTDLLHTLVDETKAFAGQVVLVHGDTHFFRLDKPLVSQRDLLPNLTRLETFGSPNVDWVKVTADPKSRNYFTFEPMVVAANHR